MIRNILFAFFFIVHSTKYTFDFLIINGALLFYKSEDIVSRNPAYVLSVLALFYSPLGSKNSPHHARTAFAVFLLSNTNLFMSTITRLTISGK